MSYLIVAIVMMGGLQMVLAQKSDSKLLEQLIKVTSSGHPFRQDLPEWIKPPTPEPKMVAAQFDPALAESAQLTTEQKQFIKANYSKLVLLVSDKMLVAIRKHVKLSEWLTAYLTDAYSKELTESEIREWIAHFGTSEGKLTLKAIFAIPQATDAENQALLRKFVISPLGTKFIEIFGDDLDAFIQRKLGEVEATVKGELEKILSPAEIKKIFNQFVAENYKKP
jgi:N-acetyl-beta-hexosaminidase